MHENEPGYPLTLTLARVCFIHSFHASPECNYDVELVLGTALCFFTNQTRLASLIYEPGRATSKGLFKAVGYVYNLFSLQGNRVCTRLEFPSGVTPSSRSRHDDRGRSGIHLESYECQIGPSTRPYCKLASCRTGGFLHGSNAPAPFVCEAQIRNGGQRRFQ